MGIALKSEKDYLLVVEDDLGLQKQLRWCFDSYEIVTAGDKESAIAQIRRVEPAVVTLDLGLPPDADGSSQGLATLQEILSIAPFTKVIILTGNQDHAHALKAISMGAYDFHQKPFDPEMLKLVVQRAFFLHTVQQENRQLANVPAASPMAGIISRDPGMLKVCSKVTKVAAASVSVMLLGESGTGKEVIARALHRLSPRNQKRFIAINCAAIPENLLESELFGYEKGAFTGAAKQTLGKLELANGGTFFLDEVGDLSMALQAKLLRFLQERVLERVGGRVEIPVDVRIICATHQNLKELTVVGKFREDLYYRLSEIVVTIPPLRERDGDAALLAHHFKREFSIKEGRAALNFSAAAIAAIENHPWPGNVRELENAIKRAVIMSDGPMIVPDDLGLDERGEDEAINLRQILDVAAHSALIKAMARADGNVSKAAEILGVSRPTLYDLMSRHGVK